MVGSFVSKEKYRRMRYLAVIRCAVNYSSIYLSPMDSRTVSPCIWISTAILACLLGASPAFAEPGVVVGSYSNQSNAAAASARDKLLNLGLDAAVQVIPGATAGPQAVIGQEAGVDLHRLSIQTLAEADVHVVIDGKVDEALWQQLPYYDNMLVSIPALMTLAEYATQMRLFATQTGLYISSIMQ